MKTFRDPRHQKRREIVQLLFAYSFRPETEQIEITEIIKQLDAIDKKIAQAAPQFPPEKLNKIDLAILRLGVFELLIEQKEPQKVIIDEAVELGKEFGSENSPKFVNGVLGAILKEVTDGKN